MCELDRGVSRRRLLGAAALATAAAASARVPLAAGAGAPADAAARPASLGAGGTPMGLPELARLAREAGHGEPLVMCDLAAVDRNASVILRFARANGWAVRPALKSFQSPGLCAYVLGLMPQPRGLVFHLRTVDEIMTRAPAGTDLLMGYPPTVGQLEAYLRSSPPQGQRRHRLRLLVDSVPLLERLAHLARSTRRRLPLDVAIEFDSGMGRGGVDAPEELSQMLRILRANRSRLRLGAVLCYDGHATLTGAALYRKVVAHTAQQRYRRYLAQLRGEGRDLYDERALIRNGPASSNYRNWAGTRVANEISPGSAFVFAGYLEDFDHDGLAPAITQASPVMRITGDNPSVPYFQTTLPGSRREEVIIEAGPWPGSTMVHPQGMAEDELSGGGFALTAPKGALELGDYVLMRPEQSGDGIDPFGTVTAVRSGRVLRRWPTFSRWSA